MSNRNGPRSSRGKQSSPTRRTGRRGGSSTSGSRNSRDRSNRGRQRRPPDRGPRGSEFRNARDTIFVSNNPNKNRSEYAGDAVMKFYEGRKTVWIKAVGSAISLAVDVAELVKQRMGFDVKVEDIKIGSMQRGHRKRGRQGQKGRDRKTRDNGNSNILSTIDIKLASSM
ncbi:MAG: hypothetical protein ACTSU5_06630 [Promethearchaeota archaeon]